MKRRFLLIVAPILILGAFFLFDHLIDRSHNEARLPIGFIPYTKEPVTEVMIEGQKYPLMIDLGSSSRLILRNEVLDKIQKTPLRDTRSIDIRGNEYSSKIYLLPEMKIRNLTLKKIETTAEDDDFLLKGSLLYSDTARTNDDILKDKPGRIGRQLFIDIDFNLFLDFHNSLMFVCNHLADRKKDGYRVVKFVSAPFELDSKGGIILNIDETVA